MCAARASHIARRIREPAQKSRTQRVHCMKTIGFPPKKQNPGKYGQALTTPFRGPRALLRTAALRGRRANLRPNAAIQMFFSEKIRGMGCMVMVRCRRERRVSSGMTSMRSWMSWSSCERVRVVA